jgi:GT2 family glycosyltransferase
MGAVLLVRREAIAQVGGFDERFFMFSEETDLCFRMRQAGWTVEFYPEAEFVHVGGASTRVEWGRMYREQLRGHLLFLAKHQSLYRAEQARRLLVRALRLRALLFRGERSATYRQAAAWLASGNAKALIESSE